MMWRMKNAMNDKKVNFIARIWVKKVFGEHKKKVSTKAHVRANIKKRKLYFHHEFDIFAKFCDWNIQITYAISPFHDICYSIFKMGQQIIAQWMNEWMTNDNCHMHVPSATRWKCTYLAIKMNGKVDKLQHENRN